MKSVEHILRVTDRVDLLCVMSLLCLSLRVRVQCVEDTGVLGGDNDAAAAVCRVILVRSLRAWDANT